MVATPTACFAVTANLPFHIGGGSQIWSSVALAAINDLRSSSGRVTRWAPSS